VARLLLDSTVLIDVLRGRPAAQRLREMRRIGDEPWVCAISVEEIWRGIREHEEPAARRLFRGLRLAPLGIAEGELAGTWRRSLANQGVTVHQADWSDRRGDDRGWGRVGDGQSRRLPDARQQAPALAGGRVARSAVRVDTHQDGYSARTTSAASTMA
jgi:hypothetical protein